MKLNENIDQIYDNICIKLKNLKPELLPDFFVMESYDIPYLKIQVQILKNDFFMVRVHHIKHDKSEYVYGTYAKIVDTLKQTLKSMARSEWDLHSESINSLHDKAGISIMAIKWNKVAKLLPPKGKDLLVWTGHHMYVSGAFFYTESYFDTIKEHHIPETFIENLRDAKGHFEEFGQKHYFDDEKVYWAELPQPPEE